MASPQEVLPSLPENWTPPSTSAKSISPLVQRKLIPAGAAYLAHVRRSINKLSFDEYDKHVEEERQRHEALNADSLNGEDDLGVGDEEESAELLLLDAKEWKKQDHYQVLGLSHLRYNATPAQIKVAHRKKVLKHHPDKKAGASHTTNDDQFFKCIQKAFEVLTNPERRRQFDSVDPHFMIFEDEVPTAADFKGKEKDTQLFFKEFTPVFENEARFSKKTPVPMLGTYEDSKEKVEAFYDFWYNFDSWRSFEYLDKEVNEGSDSRDDKRYTEKKNKSERARRKKEDTARLRGIVDLTLGLDPRIRRIKQEEKEAREAKKKSKGGNDPATAKAKAEEEKRKAEEQAKIKEEEEKVARAEAKKAKAAAANAAKKARRQQRADGDAA
ncbi:DnaJ domain-containing protein [Hygrophoropsis aurantiaca]|uniref:DnaJ domain-containing protein n=1 Tax=Hygrophoropsis aurantiaca TaxID=72124 RepID=A0ACB8AGR3_9AGAM|nr:DnaJ domain-containing protein [Hygrophoropsis aurantiaca]